MKKKLAGILTAAAVAAAALSGCAAQAGSSAQNAGAAVSGAVSGGAGAAAGDTAANSITAEGEGKVQVVPDIAEISLNITTDGTDAQQVKEENTQKYNQVVDFLRAQGIGETSIKTEDVYLNPKYDWSSDEQKLVGYTMTTSLRVSDIPIDNAGALLDSAVGQGINGIQSISYLSSEYDAKYNEALKLAVENAKSKADAIAEAGGVSADGVISVTEHGSNTAARYTSNLMSARSSVAPEAGAAADQAMSVMPGELEVEAHVTVSFQIR